MARKFIKAISTLLVVVSTLSFAGCTSKKAVQTNGDKKVKLKVYAQYSDDDNKIPFDYAIEKLKTELPNVQIEIEAEAQDDNQKLKTYAASGNMPDIFRATGDVIESFQKSNNILNLDEYVNKFNVKDAMNPSAKNLITSKSGHTFAFPIAGNDVELLYYNKEIFTKNNLSVPKTYDELLNIVSTLNSKGITPLSIFAKEKWPGVSLLDMFATRVEPKGIVKIDNLQAKASDEAYKSAADLIVKLVNAGLVSKSAVNQNYDQAITIFKQGQAAMFASGEWEIPSLTKDMGDKVDYMYIPAKDEAAYEKGKYVFSGGGSPGGYAVSPKTKDKELTSKVAWLLAKYQAEGRYILRANPVSPYKLSGTPKKALDPMMVKLSKDLEKASSTTAFAWGLTNPKVKVALEDESQKLLIKGYSANEFVSQVDKALENAK